MSLYNQSKVIKLYMHIMSSWINSNRIPKDAVICAIALNEELYINEWIDYHLALGFSHIYVYDNSDTNVLFGLKSDRVTIHHIPGKQKQFDAYNSFSKAYRKKHRWAAFIDCDEFIVLKKHNSINNFLADFSKCEAICLNWKMFGTAHHLVYANKPVTERFQLCSSTLNAHIKTICQLRYISHIDNPHYVQLINGFTYDTNRVIVNGPYNTNGTYDIACIHHYYTKSEDEFRKKIMRGRADIVEQRSLTELDDIHSKNNDIVNTDAWDYFRSTF